MRVVLLVALAALTIAGLASAQICPVYATGQTLWSTAYGNLAAGANVTISTTVWLDRSTPVLGDIEIQSGGSLYFKPGSGSIILRANQIYIRPGGTPCLRWPRPRQQLMFARCSRGRMPYCALHGPRRDHPLRQAQRLARRSSLRSWHQGNVTFTIH